MTTNATLEAANKSQRETIERLQNEVETKERTICGLMADFASHERIFQEKDMEIKELKEKIDKGGNER